MVVKVERRMMEGLSYKLDGSKKNTHESQNINKPSSVVTHLWPG